MSVADVQRILELSQEHLAEATTRQQLPFSSSREPKDQLLLRLTRRLFELRDGRDCLADFAVLLRHALLREYAALDETERSLDDVAIRIQSSAIPATPQQWKSLRFTAKPTGSDTVRLVPELWTPSWPDQDLPRLLLAAFAGEFRRTPRPVELDPIVGRLLKGWTHYTSAGQREAVRAPFLSPPRHTTLVNLPTGSGKTLAFQLAALVAAQRGDGLVLVVVPTVALAIEQELRFRDLADHAGIRLPDEGLAYHGGLEEDEKQRIKDAVSTAALPVVFTSPEACTGALSFALKTCAQRGGIRLFAIDEAHTVASWGDGFRPSFQALAGLRDYLLKEQVRQEAATGRPRGFRTLLLSATITEESLVTLERLFGHPSDRGGLNRELDVVSEVWLRPEPSYLISPRLSEDEREAAVLEAVSWLPRPLLLYVTTPASARNWCAKLQAAGYDHVDSVVGGDMSTARGERILRAWRSGDLDMVVATSAFGLGMDQAHVRTVIHACVPESVDRFYQEVGRGGRDGCACVSLLAWTDNDVDTAESLATENEISAARGRQRWQAMINDERALTFPGDIVGVRLDALPERLSYSTERNRSWNFKTLLRMARVGFLEFATLPNLSKREIESYSQEQWDERQAMVGVRILDPGHSEAACWDSRFTTARSAAIARQREEISSFRAIVDRDTPLHDLFRQAYSMRSAGIRATGSRGDCPVTRRNECASNGSPPPHLLVPDNIAAGCSSRLNSLFIDRGDASTLLWVCYPSFDLADKKAKRQLVSDLRTLLERLAAEGVVAFSVPSGWFRDKDWARLGDESPWGFVIRSSELSDDPLANNFVNTASVLPPGCTQEEIRATALLERNRHVVFLADDSPDPSHPYRRIRDRDHIGFVNLHRELDAWQF